MNRWIALSLRDFYGSEKKWQQETETKIEAKVIEAKTLQLAKERAQLNNNDPWIVFNIFKNLFRVVKVEVEELKKVRNKNPACTDSNNLVQKLWAIKCYFLPYPHLLLNLYLKKSSAVLYREKHFNSSHYKLVRVEVREL